MFSEASTVAAMVRDLLAGPQSADNLISHSTATKWLTVTSDVYPFTRQLSEHSNLLDT